MKTRHTEEPTMARIEALGRELHAALTELISGDQDRPPRPTELSREWGLEQTLCVRVCSALRVHEPYATLYHLPAVKNLRSLVAAARRRRVAVDRVERADEALSSLEEVIGFFGGNKSHLNTIVSGHVREAREKLEHSSKQNIHRGMTAIMGVRTRVALTSFFVYPNADDPSHADTLAIYGSGGLQRLRPDLTYVLGGRRGVGEVELQLLEEARSELGRGDFRKSPLATALADFCTEPLPTIEVLAEGDRLLYVLPGGRDESFAELDLFFASIEQRAVRPRDPESSSLFAFVPRSPIQTLVFDVFVHRDVWTPTGARMEVHKLDGVITPQEMGQGLSRMEQLERVEDLGSRSSAIPTHHLPRHAEMMGSIRETMGWSGDEFRLFRAIVKYPLIGFGYQIVIERSALPS